MMKTWIQDNQEKIFDKVALIYKVLAVISGIGMALKILSVLGIGLVGTIFSLGLLLPLAGVMAIIAIPVILLLFGVRVYLFWMAGQFAQALPIKADRLKQYAGILLVFAIIGLVFSGDSSFAKTMALGEILFHGFVLYALSVMDQGDRFSGDDQYRRPL